MCACRRLAEQLARTEKHGAIWANQSTMSPTAGAYRGHWAEIWRQTRGQGGRLHRSVGPAARWRRRHALKKFNPKSRSPPHPLGAAIYSWIKTGRLEMHGTSITEGIGQSRSPATGRRAD